MSWIFEDIDSTYVTNGFKSTRNLQTVYIRKWAFKNHQNNVSKTTVVRDSSDKTVVAFYTLSAAQVAFNDVSEQERERLPGYPIPAVRICQFAVDKRFARQGLGTRTILHAFEKVVNISQTLGIYAVILDVERDNQDAIQFYEHIGFESLPDKVPDSHLRIYMFKIEDIAATLSVSRQ